MPVESVNVWLKPHLYINRIYGRAKILNNILGCLLSLNGANLC